MYQKILVTLDATRTDRAIIDHIKQLAKILGSKVALLHVADGWAARAYGADAVSPEIDEDTAYLQRVHDEFAAIEIEVEFDLAYGDPAREIVRYVHEKGFDLIAMSTHGHRFLSDLFLGTTANKVQHRVQVPVLLLRAE
jgi:nucleotide-binding universal stress UspA family protein